MSGCYIPRQPKKPKTTNRLPVGSFSTLLLLLLLLYEGREGCWKGHRSHTKEFDERVISRSLWRRSLFVSNDTIEGPRAPPVKPGRRTHGKMERERSLLTFTKGERERDREELRVS